MAVDFWTKNSVKLRNVSEVAEIDEAKFGKRKYNRGHVVEGKWVVGGMERESNNISMAVVWSRDEAAPLNIIKDNVLPDTHIHTDSWSAYKNLSAHG